MTKCDNEVGNKFERLTIIKFVEKVRFPSGGSGYKYLCKCECGKSVVATIADLRSGHTKSCGCFRKDELSARKTHGLKGHPLYRIWSAMKSRCYNKKCSCYHNYGARGIRVCDEWLVFENFYEWCLASEWERHLELDRFPDVNGDYGPSNCRLATRKQQQNNRRNTIRVAYKGELLTLSEISEKSGIPYGTLYSRYRPCSKVKSEIQKL